jgi:hypothetical protein
MVTIFYKFKGNIGNIFNDIKSDNIFNNILSHMK